ncbi:crotonase/enoyl-CoA hydratase family protein [Yunchengibacter salinarum]|uniref:crotonase/enoyl-CoA hydratase family protein n=1 Tax=Yunchengibacter salinarum TaxID=3133399 RepID=UPI0035B5E349
MSVSLAREGAVRIITIHRPAARNAIDPETAEALRAAFEAGEVDESTHVTVLTGAGDHFCAGADLKAVSRHWHPQPGADHGPLGPTRMRLTKPLIAAVEGYAVAGGLELACLADMRVASESAVFGVFCRRFGVPLIDGGTVRLPRLIGESRAMDMILTGRPVTAQEAHGMGLANRLVPRGRALETALDLAQQIAAFPQTCLRGDRQSVHQQWALPEAEALKNESRIGDESLKAGAAEGAARFTEGEGRHGQF